MTARTVSVEARVVFTFEIDDEVTSEWDGANVLNVLEKRRDAEPPLYTALATTESLLGHLGIELSVENRRMGNIDGWADFPEAAAKGNPYSVQWDIERVEVSP